MDSRLDKKKIEEHNNLAAAQAFVKRGLERKASGIRESASGPGSTIVSANQALQLIRDTIVDHNVHSVLDLGCGDWNWMQHLGLPDLGESLSVSYEGWDSSERLVKDLRTAYGKEQICFRMKDITTSPLPEVDLIIARDVLFHLDEVIAQRILEKIKTRCRFFISSCYLGVLKNTNIEPSVQIKGWGFYNINLNIPPFNLFEKMNKAILEPHCRYRGENRFICLYQF